MKQIIAQKIQFIEIDPIEIESLDKAISKEGKERLLRNYATKMHQVYIVSQENFMKPSRKRESECCMNCSKA